MLDDNYKVIPSTLSGLVGQFDPGSPEPIPEEVPQFIPPAEEIPAGGEDMPPANFEDPSAAQRKPAGGVSKAQGRLMTLLIDRSAATGLSLYAKGNTQDYRATPDEYSDLEEAVIVYMQESGMELPPIWGLIIAILTIYGMKIPEARTARLKALEAEREKIRKEREEQAALLAANAAALNENNNEQPGSAAPGA